MKMTNPELKVVRFENEDVIATSLYILEEMTTDHYYGYPCYVAYEGHMEQTGQEGTWRVIRSGDVFQILPEDLPSIQNQANSHTYYAYTDQYDGLYTKGVSFYELYGQQ